jgi:hypothetical protein
MIFIGHQKRRVLMASLVLIWGIVCETPFTVGGSRPPDWVNGESSQYSRERYLTGVGYGNSRKAAEDEAYAAISRIFQANIQSKTREWEEYLQSSGKSEGPKQESQVTRKIFIDQLTQVSTQKVLENVSIAEVWTDSQTDRTYALAVMDRGHSAAMIQGRIEELDRQARTLFESATRVEEPDSLRQAGNKLQVVRDLHAAFKSLLLREGLNTDLKIISPEGRGVDSQLPPALVGKALRQVLSQKFHVALELSGPHAEKIRSAILRGLTREGLVVIDPASALSASGGGSNGSKEEKADDVLVKGEMELEPLQLQDRPFYRWRVQFTLIDQSNDRVLGNLARNGREGHLNPSEAEARAVRAAQRVVQEEVGPALAGIIFGEKNMLEK